MRANANEYCCGVGRKGGSTPQLMKRKANELHVFLLLDQVDLQDQQCKKAEAISPSEARSIWMRASDPSSIILQPSKSGPGHEVEDIQYPSSTASSLHGWQRGARASFSMSQDGVNRIRT